MSGRDLSGIIGIHWNYSDSTSRFPFSIPISYPKRYPVCTVARMQRDGDADATETWWKAVRPIVDAMLEEQRGALVRALDA